jgi:hypothetical protein
MSTEQFNIFWAASYPETGLISYQFRHIHPDRWFRIHSLPGSQRYAYSEEEWDILLTRQNNIITDLLGNDPNVFLVTGDYAYNGVADLHPTQEEEVFQSYTFYRLNEVDLHSLSPEEYEEGQFHRPAVAETIWVPHQHDPLLRAIANCSVMAFFVSPTEHVIVAPYDGGVDFVLKDTNTRNFYKQKYKDWLSFRSDGL